MMWQQKRKSKTILQCNLNLRETQMKIKLLWYKQFWNNKFVRNIQFWNNKFVRNIFDQYSQPENKLTHCLVSCIYEDTYLLNSFLQTFCPNFFDKKSNLKIEEQSVPGERHLSDDENEKKGLPDAVIYLDGKCLILGSKISSKLERDQLIRHQIGK